MGMADTVRRSMNENKIYRLNEELKTKSTIPTIKELLKAMPNKSRRKVYELIKEAQIEVDIERLDQEDFVSFVITEHRSGHTGKLFKKPRLQGDCVLIGAEARKFKKFINQREDK